MRTVVHMIRQQNGCKYDENVFAMCAFATPRAYLPSVRSVDGSPPPKSVQHVTPASIREANVSKSCAIDAAWNICAIMVGNLVQTVAARVAGAALSGRGEAGASAPC
jgi:hypothetical protein